jgi:hypothetical protein
MQKARAPSFLVQFGLSITDPREGRFIMTRTEMLELFGRRRVVIEPACREFDGMWHIKIAAEGIRECLLDARSASALADELRREGESLLATRIEISIEQVRRHTVSESVRRLRPSAERPIHCGFGERVLPLGLQRGNALQSN